ncbi:MAG: hypothetical protein EF806_00820 [Candidatus Methanoliparum thermophilum]|uniref:Uncharacterized protein n=2 Tax=Candidatus Methanoliparum TaxID=2545692 RepID=A0A520KU78_METT2|nr:MAG: hypothetical protein EF806_00820 [Candidatus Methanoliparum thermophilum]
MPRYLILNKVFKGDNEEDIVKEIESVTGQQIISTISCDCEIMKLRESQTLFKKSVTSFLKAVKKVANELFL